MTKQLNPLDRSRNTSRRDAKHFHSESNLVQLTTIESPDLKLEQGMIPEAS